MENERVLTEEMNKEQFHNTFYVAPFSRRLLASIIDFLFSILLTLIMVTSLEGPFKNSKPFLEQINIIKDVQSQCSLFVQNGEDYITVLDEAKEQVKDGKIVQNADYAVVNRKLEKSLAGFYENNLFFKGDEGVLEYKNLKIGKNKITFTNENKQITPYFLDRDGEAEVNSAVPEKQLFEFYKVAYSEHAIPTLDIKNPQYAEARRLTFVYIVSYIFVWIAISYLIFFWIIPACDRRTHKTIGKWLLKLGVVNRDGYAVSFWHFFARSAFEYFIELLLSLFSFLIPFGVSIGFAAFRHDASALHDYICGTHVIDTDGAYVYLNRDEQKKKAEKMNSESLTISKR